MESQRSRLRRRIESSASFTADELMEEIGCTRPAVHQTISQMTDEGYQFSRTTIKGQRGAPIRFTVIPPKKREPTLEERVTRIEHLLEHHRLGSIFIPPSKSA